MANYATRLQSRSPYLVIMMFNFGTVAGYTFIMKINQLICLVADMMRSLTDWEERKIFSNIIVNVF